MNVADCNVFLCNTIQHKGDSGGVTATYGAHF
jgi:hypothetical protein